MKTIKNTLFFVFLFISNWFLGQTHNADQSLKKVQIRSDVFDSILVTVINDSDSAIYAYEKGLLRVINDYSKGKIIRQLFFYEDFKLDLIYDMDGIGLTHFQVELDSGDCTLRRDFYSPSNIKAIGKGDSIVNIVEYDEDSGNIIKRYSMLNHMLHNEYLVYSEDGSLKSLVTYKNGKRDGPSFEYYSNGQTYSHLFYKNGAVVGKRMYFNKMGELIEPE